MKRTQPNLVVRSLKLTIQSKPPQPVFLVRTGSTALFSVSPNFKVGGKLHGDGVVELRQVRESSST